MAHMSLMAIPVTTNMEAKMTLYDLGMEIQKIREAINALKTKGAKNASRIVYATSKCNSLIQAINETIAEKQQSIDKPRDEGLYAESPKEGEDGGSHPGSSDPDSKCGSGT